MNMEENTEEIVVGLLALQGGKLVGRTRMHKQVYLLDRCGAEFGLKFRYHRYGPYSFELAGACIAANAERRIETEERVSSHRVPYSVFRSSREATLPERLGHLDAGRAAKLLEEMNKVSDVVLELAATIIFLHDDWSYFGKGRISAVEETRKRKPLKATEERLGLASSLLHSLGLWKQTLCLTA